MPHSGVSWSEVCLRGRYVQSDEENSRYVLTTLLVVGDGNRGMPNPTGNVSVLSKTMPEKLILDLPLRLYYS